MKKEYRMYKKYNFSKKNFIYIDIMLFAFSILTMLVSIKQEINLYTIGIQIIFLSIWVCYKVKDNIKLLLLFSIMSFINISISYTDLINEGVSVATWQIPLRNTEFNIQTAISILLFLSIVNYFLLIPQNTTSNNITVKHKIDGNPIISYIGILIMFIILFTGYSSDVTSSTNYISNENPLIEYAIVIYFVSWLYGKNYKNIDFLLKVYAVFYIFYTFYQGDRSASFLMILLYFIIYFEKKINITIPKIMFLAVAAIVIANIVVGYREGIPLEIKPIIDNIVKRGLYSDTVSYSYYASITITAGHNMTNSLEIFLRYIVTFITGGGEFASIGNIVKNNYLYNVGGGVFPSHFYFGLGYTGVVLVSVVFVWIINRVYSKDGEFRSSYQVLIPVFIIRWYLYSPTNLFRSVFVITSILLLLSKVFNSMIKKY